MRFAAEIALQRTHLEVTPEIGFDSLRRGEAQKEWVVRHLCKRAARRRDLLSASAGPLGGIENQWTRPFLMASTTFGRPSEAFRMRRPGPLFVKSVACLKWR